VVFKKAFGKEKHFFQNGDLNEKVLQNLTINHNEAEKS
jgi:hypothetical protein